LEVSDEPEHHPDCRLKTEAEERARTVCGVPAAGGMVLMGIVWSGYRRWRQQ
jgi:hypothetical protein